MSLSVVMGGKTENSPHQDLSFGLVWMLGVGGLFRPWKRRKRSRGVLNISVAIRQGEDRGDGRLLRAALILGGGASVEILRGKKMGVLEKANALLERREKKRTSISKKTKKAGRKRSKKTFTTQVSGGACDPKRFPFSR